VFYDIKTAKQQIQAGNLRFSSKQMLRLFGVYAMHISLMVMWSILFIAAQSGWLANLTLEGYYLGECMRDGNAYTGIVMGLVMGNGGFFVYANPRSRVIIISYHLLLAYHAVCVYMRVQQVGLLNYTPLTADGRKCYHVLYIARQSWCYIYLMLIRAAVCHISFWMNSTLEKANGKRLFAFILNKYLAIYHISMQLSRIVSQ